MEVESSMKVIIKTNFLGREADEKGRVKTSVYGLDITRIHAIYYFDHYYYIVYETDKVDFYKQYSVSEIPELATHLPFKIKAIQIAKCKGCGSRIEWDADEPYCPKCGMDFPGYIRVERKLLEINISEKEELEQFASKMFNTQAKYKTSYYSGIAGGYRPQFTLKEMNIKLYTVNVCGVGIIENPKFIESHYDEIWETEHTENGKYIIIKTRSVEGSEYKLLTLE